MSTQDSRIKIKRSTVTGTAPTVGPSTDHTQPSPAWSATDIYKGELFYNQADGVLWTRSDSGIDCIQGTAKVVIPTAQVLTLNSVPVQIVAAPGSGYAIEVVSGMVSIAYSTVTYATNTTIGIISAGADDSQYELDFLAATITKKNVLSPNLSSNNKTQMLENTALNVTVQTGNPTAGDSEITVYLNYRIITL